MKAKKRKYVRKNGVAAFEAEKKAFNLSALVPEDGIDVTPRSIETSEMYTMLDKLAVGQSYRMPIDQLKTFNNARVTHKRATSKIFIVRKLDKYNIRCWRLADDTKLVTRTKKKIK